MPTMPEVPENAPGINAAGRLGLGTGIDESHWRRESFVARLTDWRCGRDDYVASCRDDWAAVGCRCDGDLGWPPASGDDYVAGLDAAAGLVLQTRPGPRVPIARVLGRAGWCCRNRDGR